MGAFSLHILGKIFSGEINKMSWMKNNTAIIIDSGFLLLALIIGSN